MDLLNHIDEIFCRTGVLSQLGKRYTPEQHKYATLVGKSLLNEDFNLSMLEAETGIGKTIGYITPILIYIALCKQNNIQHGKFVISTFSRQLQKQIFDQDILFAKQLVKHIGLDSSAIAAYRMGRQAFFSTERTINCCRKIIAQNPSRELEINEFKAFVLESCNYDSGLWSSYINDHGALPKGISFNDICLLNKQKIDNDAYLLHLERAKHSDILITNHSSLLQPNMTGLTNTDIEAIVVDEAHTIGDLCFDMFNRKSSLNEISKTVHELGNIIGKNKVKKSIQSLETIDSLVRSSSIYDSGDIICDCNDESTFNNISNSIFTMSSELTSAHKSFEKKISKAEYSLHDVEFNQKIEDTLFTLNNWQSPEVSQFQLSAISLSSVRRSASLTTVDIFKNRHFAKIMKGLTQKLILTSGTLSDTKQSRGFEAAKRDLGFKLDKISFECSLAPSNYGKMKFVLCGREIPKPLLNTRENDESQFNPDWLNNTVKMIEKARSSGEPVLILTVSHQESDILYKALKDKSEILLHKKGNTLTELAKSFTDPEQTFKVLITSAGWEGLNLRNHKGEQFIYHLFISRLPFIPPETVFEFLIKNYIKKQGKHFREGLNLSWINVVKKMIPILIQGFGRGIRGPKDIITVWIADSRMPHHRKDQNSILLNAVPARFLEEYFKAEIFGEAKKEVIFI